MTFPLWFSGNEQVLRYYAVKANLFARQAALPERLLRGPDPYSAYLLDNIAPGGPGDPAKSVARLLATEGVVAHLFWRWVTSADLQTRYVDAAFYAQFGTTAAAVPPELNVYLKLLHVIHEARPATTMDLVLAYRRAWPDEAAAVDRLVSDALLGQAPTLTPGIWLANAGFHVGTTMFDQWRAAPAVHTFDLNAASIVDLVSVGGIDLALARQIVRRLPVERIGDLRGVPGMTPDVDCRLEQMAAAMAGAADGSEGETTARLAPVLWAYPKRAALAWLAAAVPAMLLFRRVAGRGWKRAAFDGLAASLVTLAAGWVTWPSLTATFATVVVFGLPAVWTDRRRGRPWRLAGLTLACWLAAALPAWLLLSPLF